MDLLGQLLPKSDTSSAGASPFSLSGLWSATWDAQTPREDLSVHGAAAAHETSQASAATFNAGREDRAESRASPEQASRRAGAAEGGGGRGASKSAGGAYSHSLASSRSNGTTRSALTDEMNEDELRATIEQSLAVLEKTVEQASMEKEALLNQVEQMMTEFADIAVLNHENTGAQRDTLADPHERSIVELKYRANVSNDLMRTLDKDIENIDSVLVAAKVGAHATYMKNVTPTLLQRMQRRRVQLVDKRLEVEKEIAAQSVEERNLVRKVGHEVMVHHADVTHHASDVAAKLGLQHIDYHSHHRDL